MVLGRMANLFPVEKWFYTEKNQLLVGKTKNTVFCEIIRPDSKKIAFLFSQGKHQFLLGTNWFLHRKPKRNCLFWFSLRKIGFAVQNYLFPRK